MDQSDAGSAGTFSRWTNQTQEARVYTHDGPIRRRKRGSILTMDQSEREVRTWSVPRAFCSRFATVRTLRRNGENRIL
eukprot:5839815-Pyramimonas_sp.AAC.1